MFAKPAATIATTQASRPLTGILILMGAIVCFCCMDASAKWLARHINPLQTSGMRYLVTLVVVGFFLNPKTKPGILRTQKPVLQIVRALTLIGMTIGCWIALRYLPLTQVTAINFSAPLMTALLAGPMLGEKIGPRRLIAVLVGFAGVLIVTRPFGQALQPAVLLSLAAAVSNSFYLIITRQLAKTDSSETTMFYTSVFGAVLVSPLLFFYWKTPDSALVWLLMIGLGLLGAFGHWLLILAHRHAPASVLAPFFYSQIIGATAFSLTVFGESPDRWTIVGGLIVIGSGLYLLYRERVRQKFPSADVAV
ncbi:MAG: DMT family transporter [Nibricoccus sp.]